MPETIQNFISQIKSTLNNNEFVKLTLGKASKKDSELRNIYVRLIEIKEGKMLSFTFRNKTNDFVKNYSFEDALKEIQKYLGNDFLSAHLFSTNSDVELLFNKKRKATIRSTKPTFSELSEINHDKKKKRILKIEKNIYLQQLGITNREWKIIPDKNDKFKQINKYVEVFENLIKQVSLQKKIRIVDMGSGKGYLTFALYDYLKNILKINAEITGVELRKELVEKCNSIAKKCKFDNLDFREGDIKGFASEKIDILIALHACDTATDEAIFKGIEANASIIVVAPCCHKQIRKEMKKDVSDDPIIKYGILLERQSEMITDTIRALILESYGYKTNVFEFISTEHTPKNIMITASKSDKKIDKKEIFEKIKKLKSQYRIKYHQLEKYLGIEI
jgi:protein-L-isoaspartate O-methyltransferase